MTHAGETIAVSATSGGVGTIAAQLLRERGVRVPGIASPDGTDAFIDLYDPDYVRLATYLANPLP